MSKRYFSQSEIDLLQSNPNITRVSKHEIHYSESFKMTFMDEYLKGIMPREIFEQCGLSVELLGKSRIEQAAFRLKKKYSKFGMLGFLDSSKSIINNLAIENLPKEHRVLKLQARIKFLEMENDFLKKLKGLGRSLP